MDFIKFWTICSSNSIVLEKEQIDDIKRYSEELTYWNEKVNLVSRKDIENILERHILHSISVLKYVSVSRNAKCLDIGTGGGLPGIPISIVRKDLHFTLIDSIEKKIKITEMLAKHTGNRNINTIRCRAEELSEKKQFKSYFDYIFSRAVGKLDWMLSMSVSMLKPNGKFIFYKGGDLGNEIDTAYMKFPKIKIEEIKIDMFGSDWFKNENKAIIVCSFNK